MVRQSKAVIAHHRGAAVNPHRVLVAALTVTLFISAIVAVVTAANMGQSTAALIIALVAGGAFSAAALC